MKNWDQKLKEGVSGKKENAVPELKSMSQDVQINQLREAQRVKRDMV